MEFFVAPNGASNGTGLIDKPWDLDTALSGAAGQIKPGDTVNMRAGTYHTALGTDGFNATLSGLPGQPIIFCNYQREHVVIDGKGTEWALASHGADVYFIGWGWPGIEVMDSSGVRTTTTPGTANPLSWGPSIYGPRNRLINIVIHDTAQGLSSYDASPDAVVHGCIALLNGWIGPDRNHGHGFYAQNQIGQKEISACFAIANADEGLQIYGSGNAHVEGFRILGVTAAITSCWPITSYQYNFLIAGGNTRTDNQIKRLISFFPPAAEYGFVNIGQYTDGGDVIVEDSTFIGGYTGPVVERQSGPVSFQRNKIVVAPVDAATNLPIAVVTYGPGATQAPAGYVWDHNQYFGNPRFRHGTYANDAAGNDAFSGSITDLPGFRAATGFDANSTYQDAMPKGAWISIEPNQYESKRANITITNWDLLDAVAVDLSAILSPGDSYYIQDAQNPAAAPVAQGTYSGPVSIPMKGLVAAKLIGLSSTVVPHSAPAFGTFVVWSPAGVLLPPPPPNADPTPIPAPTPTPTPTPAPALFAVGDGVQVKTNLTTPLNVRATPDPTTAAIGAEAPGNKGKLIGGPVISGGFVLYQVAWVDGVNGWSVQDYLTDIGAAPTPSPTPTPTPTPVPGVYTFAADPSHLPPGLSLSSQGVVSGTPTLAGTFQFTVSCADNTGRSGTLATSITVTAPPPPPPNPTPAPAALVIDPTPAPAGTVGQPYSFTFKVLP